MLRILPLSIRSPSESIELSDWFLIITQCLAPLLVHILVGIPSAVYLHSSRPSWHDKVTFYNPTTIIWRYFVIVDRRIRAKRWNAFDMAASNVRFWTGDRWDGSEYIMERSKLYCTRVADTPRIKFNSQTTVETAIVAVQGMQAILNLSKGFAGGWQVSIATMFFPLALIGLLRLPATYWLSEEATYTDHRSIVGIERPAARNPDDDTYSDYRTTLDGEKLLLGSPSSDTSSLASKASPSTKPLLTIRYSLEPNDTPPYIAHRPNSWRGWLVRIFFLTCILALASLSITLTLPFLNFWDIFMSITAYLQAWFYSFMLVSTFLIIAKYANDEEATTTTVIPCIHTLWYKIYTGILFLLMLIFILFAALETKKSTCGSFTTFPAPFGVCPTGGRFLSSAIEVSRPDGPNGSLISTQFFDGIYRTVNNGSSLTTRFIPFNGWCRGSWTDGKAEFTLPDWRLVNDTDWFQVLKEASGLEINIGPLGTTGKEFDVVANNLQNDKADHMYDYV
jgi:hypothetical protein